jgi:type IV secretion system protein VirB4
MSGRDTASLETGAGARAANTQVDDLGEVIRSLDKKAQGEYSLRFLVAARSVDELRGIAPAVHRVFADARAQVMEETLGNLSAFYALFPGNQKFNVFPMWLAEDHQARLSSIFAPNLGHICSEDLDNEYLNIFETRTRTPFFQDVYVDGVPTSRSTADSRTSSTSAAATRASSNCTAAGLTASGRMVRASTLSRWSRPKATSPFSIRSSSCS